MTIFLIQRGEKGQDVAAWQNFLISQGVSLPNFGADGDFGPETETATKEWQYNQRLPESGGVDAATADRANSLGFGDHMNRDQVSRQDELAAFKDKLPGLPNVGSGGYAAVAVGAVALGLLWWGMRD